MIGSLLVAVLIVILTIFVVTVRLGPSAELREEDERDEESDDNSGRGSLNDETSRRRLASGEIVIFGPPAHLLSAGGPEVR
jgi:uncharacterized membrane protein